MALWDNVQGKWKLASTTWTDDSGNGNTLTASASAPTAVAGHAGGANLGTNFSGSTQYLYITDASQVGLDITGAITISVWVKPSNTGSTKTYIGKHAASPDFGYAVYQNTSNKFGFLVSGNGTSSTSVISNTTLATGTWYHIAAVYDGVDLRIYVNGLLDCTPVAYTAGIYNNAAGLYIGANSVPNAYTNAVIDDAAVWSRALSDSEIYDVFYLSDDFVSTGAAPAIDGVVKDRNGNAIDCSVYNVRVNAYPKNNTASAPARSVLVTLSSGAFTLPHLVNGTKYLVTFEYEGLYAPSRSEERRVGKECRS